ncbi:ABC transporter permease [Xylophilus sp. ASV27]|uniref:ABC transporter permease n=1 Tax=Xylophilus sp. ASV27 TaxID=2795129 RepID=UPI0018EBDA2F|nr:ABC transporter permease [Xylophilus sp. ASV27]
MNQSASSVASMPMGNASVKAVPADNRTTARMRRETLAAIAVFCASALLLLVARLVSPSFNGIEQAGTILILSSFLIVAAYGQGLVVLIGGLDLSLPSLITLGGILSAGWIGRAAPEMQPYLYLPALAACALVGAVSGVGVALLRVPAFIMTLAMGVIVYSACLGVTKGTPSGSAPRLLSSLMHGDWLGVPMAIPFVLAFIAVAVFIQKGTLFGVHLYAMGSNANAARAAGLRVRLLTIAAYAASAACAGLVGMMLVGYSNGATLRMGDAYLLPAIAAVVIGGSSIFGGRGTFVGTVGGAVLLTVLSMLITSLGLAQGWRTVIEGSVILLALLLLQDQVLDSVRRRFSR